MTRSAPRTTRTPSTLSDPSISRSPSTASRPICDDAPVSVTVLALVITIARHGTVDANVVAELTVFTVAFAAITDHAESN